MKKKFVILVILLIFILLLNGCSGGRHIFVFGGIQPGENSLNGEYRRFYGHYFKRVQFNENDIVKFNFNQDTKRGNIEASLINSDGEEIDFIKDEKDFQIEENDNYKIQVNGSGHRGSFKLEWQVLE